MGNTVHRIFKQLSPAFFICFFVAIPVPLSHICKLSLDDLGSCRYSEVFVSDFCLLFKRLNCVGSKKNLQLIFCFKFFVSIDDNEEAIVY